MATSDRSTSKRFFYADGGKRRGPVTPEELRQLAASGKLSRDDTIWQEGIARGVPAGRVKGLFSAESSDPSPPGINGFFYSQKGTVHGPISASDLKLLVVDGTIWPSALIWKEGTTRKVSAENAVRLFGKMGRPEPTVSETAQPFQQAQESVKEPRVAAAKSETFTTWPVIRVTHIDDVFRRGFLGLFHGYQILAVVEDGFETARSICFPDLEEQDCTTAGISRYIARCSFRRTIPFANIVDAELHGTVHKTLLGKIYPGGTVELWLRTRSGRRRLCLHRRDATNVYQALRHGLNERLKPDVRWRSTGPGLVVSTLIFLVLFVLFGILTAFIADAVALESMWIMLLPLAASILSVYGLRRALRRDYSNRMPFECLAAPVWPLPRPTGSKVRQPFRSKILGRSLKLIGFAWLLLLIFYLPAKVRRAAELAGPGAPTIESSYVGQGIAFLSIPAVMLLYLGHGIARTGATSNTDNRRQVVYLRSFCLDGKTTLQPGSPLAAFLGVSGAGSLKAWFLDSLHGMKLVVNLKFFQCVHPLRLTRLFLGIVADSTEHSLVGYFSSLGPVFAIGKPGERIAETGAVREYVADDEWQDVVLQRLQRSQAVILQPSQSLGMKWELEAVFRLLGSEKILIVFAKAPGLANDYEDLRTFFHDRLELSLPRCLPYRGQPVVVWFERDRTVRWTEVSYRSPASWLFTGDAVDLEYTLRPFVQGIHGGERELPRPVRRHAWHQRALGWVSVGIWAFAFGTLIQQGSTWRASAPAYVSSNFMTITGTAFPYAVEIPESWTPRVPSAGITEHELNKPGVGLIKIVAHQGQEDLSQLAQVLVATTKTQMGLLSSDVVVELQQPKLIGDRSCVEVRLRNRYRTGATEFQRIIAYSGPDGTFLINVVAAENITAAQDQEIQRILESVRFVRSFAEVQKSYGPSGALPAPIVHEQEMRVLQGKSVPYEMQVPHAWTVADPTHAIVEYMFKTPSGGELYVIASPEQEDVSGYAEVLLTHERNALGDKGTASLETDEAVTINAHSFKLIAVKVQVTDGASVVVRCAAHSSEVGTLIIKALIVDNLNTTAEQAAVGQIIQSVHFRGAGDAVIRLDDENDFLLTPRQETMDGPSETEESPDPFGNTLDENQH